MVVAGIYGGLGSVTAFGLGLLVMALSSLSVVVLAAASGAALTTVRRDDVRAALRELPSFGLFSTASAAAQRIDTILVAVLLPGSAIAAAGAYFAATRLVAAFEYLPQTLGRAVLPDVARAYVAGARDSPANVVEPSVAMLLALSIPVPFAMVLGGPWVLQILLGEDPPTVGWIMAWLALALPFRFLGYLYGTLLTGADAQGARVRALITALIMLVGVDAIAIPALGIAGAVIGYLSSSLALVSMYERDARRSFGLGRAARHALLPLIVSSGALAPALLIRAVLPESASQPAALAMFGVTYIVIIGIRRLPYVIGRGRSPRKEVDGAG